MRPPPGGTSAHRFRTSAWQTPTMITRLCGRMNRRTLSGATAGGGAVAAVRAGGRSARVDGGRGPGVAVAARRGGVFGVAAAGTLAAVGAGAAVCAAAGCDGATAVAGGDEGTAAAECGAVGAEAVAAGCAGGGMTALTAVLQADDSLATLRSRHCKASRPPGCTPEQFAMKSERQEPRIALTCAGVGCCACVASSPSAHKINAAAAARPKTIRNCPMRFTPHCYSPTLSGCSAKSRSDNSSPLTGFSGAGRPDKPGHRPITER
jgi:hypothetical protein